MMNAVIYGVDGNVGSAVFDACKKEGWTIYKAHAFEYLKVDAPFVIFDCLAPGTQGYAQTWTNCFESVARAANLINASNHEPSCAAIFLCSTPWLGVTGNDPYSDSKHIIEQMAYTHNRHGAYTVIVDRIGMINPTEPGTQSRFEESVRQNPVDLGERIIASVLHAIEHHRKA